MRLYLLAAAVLGSSLAFTSHATKLSAAPAGEEAFQVIRGTVTVAGYQPDGDSIRFVADDSHLFDALYRGNRVRLSKRDGSVQLRLEGMDTPETHYEGKAQPYGDTARDAFLQRLGYQDVHFAGNGETVVSSRPAMIRVAVLTRAVETHGRPIAYLMVSGYEALGTAVQLDPALLKSTLNYAMVASGDAYPLFYTSTPSLHRTLLREAAQKARTEKRGLWKLDSTASFALFDQASIGPQ